MRTLIVAVMFFLTAGLTSALAAALEARVSLSKQRMYVYEYGELIADWPVSTGRKGFRTPTGQYRPTRMTPMHYSRTYDNAPMPYSVFFHGGYAIHGTDKVRALGRPASHGCVRLRNSHARDFYDLVDHYGRRNTRIVIRR